MASYMAPAERTKVTTIVFRLLLVLTVLGIMATLMPSNNSVARADYDAAPISGGEPDL